MMLRNRTPLRYTFLHLTRSATGAGLFCPEFTPGRHSTLNPGLIIQRYIAISHAQNRQYTQHREHQHSHTPALPGNQRQYTADKEDAEVPCIALTVVAGIAQPQRGQHLHPRQCAEVKNRHFPCKILIFRVLHRQNHTPAARNSQVSRPQNQIQYTPVHPIQQIQAERETNLPNSTQICPKGINLS